MKPKHSLRNFLLLTGSIMLTLSSANADTLYWDGGTADIGTDGNGLSNGAAGNWNSSLLNWDQGSGLAHTSWDNTNTLANPADIAVFGRTGIAAGTVTLTAPITVGGLTFYGTGFTLAAGTQGLTFGGTDNNIALFGSNGAATATITGLVGGSGNVSMASANPFVTGTTTFSGISAGGWSGSTTINSNTVLTTTTTSSNVNRVLDSTSGITLNGGAIQFNRATNAQLNAISDSAPITVNGGGRFGVTSGDAGGASAIETIGAVTVNSGQMDFNWTNGASSGAQIILGTSGTGLSRSGTSAVTFSGNLGSTGRWKVTGGGTTTAGQIIGPWATTGGANGIAAQTDYAVYDSDFVAAAGISATAETTWTTAANAYTMDIGTAASGTTLTDTRDITALRISGTRLDSVDAGTDIVTLSGHGFADGEQVVFGKDAPGGLTAGTTYFVRDAAADTFKVSTTSGGSAVNISSTGTLAEIRRSTTPTTLTLASGANLGTNGILNGSAFDMTIAPGTGGVVTLPSTSAGNLYVTSGRSNIAISAPIENNTASGVLTLVKGGSNTLTLTGTNSYTGGTVINAGTLSISDVANLGGAGANVTFGGSGTLLNSAGSTRNFSSGTLTVNEGATAILQPGAGSAGITFATTTGSGNIVANLTQNATMNLGNASGFTGNVQTRSGGNINQGGGISLQFSSLADAAGSFLQFGGGQSDSNQSQNIAFNGSAPLVFNNRVVQTLPRTSSNWVARDSILSNNSTSAANTWTINTDLDWEYTTNTGARNLILSGSNTGSNAFNGLLSDGNSGNTPLALSKTGNGTWIVSGANTYTGATSVTGGTLLINGNSSTATGAVTVTGASLAATATLGGIGTVGGNTTLNNFSVLSPGQSPGTLTFAGDLTVNNGANYVFEGGDLTNVNGTLDLNDNWTLTLGTGFQDGGSVILFDYFALAADPDLAPTINMDGLGFMPTILGGLTVTDNGTAIVLNGVSVIPEPSTALLGALGAMLLLRRRR